MAWIGTALLRLWLLLLCGVWIVDAINGVWTSHSYFGHLLSSSCCHIDNYCVASKQRATYLGWQEKKEDARLKPRCVMLRSFCDSRIRISWHWSEVLKAVVLITLWWTFCTADVRTRHWTQYWTTSCPYTLDIHLNIIIPSPLGSSSTLLHQNNVCISCLLMLLFCSELILRYKHFLEHFPFRPLRSSVVVRDEVTAPNRTACMFIVVYILMCSVSEVGGALKSFRTA